MWGLTSCADWKRRAAFPVATSDAAGLAWSPSGSCLALYDSPLTYLVCLHRLSLIMVARCVPQSGRSCKLS